MIGLIYLVVIVSLFIGYYFFKRKKTPKKIVLPFDQSSYFLNIAIDAAKNSMLEGKGGPFGAVIVNNGKIIAVGTNQVTSLNDPTAHAEVMAIRLACQKLGTFQLLDCELYTSCEPCPMCFGAIYWARPRHIYYAATKLDAAQVGFDDSLIYQELQTPEEQRLIKTTHVTTCQPKAKELFTLWQDKKDKIVY